MNLSSDAVDCKIVDMVPLSKTIPNVLDILSKSFEVHTFFKCKIDSLKIYPTFLFQNVLVNF